ncbi:hypothetical protein VNO77_10872 [Canavalia gladiata]|uniref:Uncharacterized protein n=1 Tax=Canavalia gladiata TaxID=3824 RepID=A0AAN9MAV9_CANGL
MLSPLRGEDELQGAKRNMKGRNKAIRIMLWFITCIETLRCFADQTTKSPCSQCEQMFLKSSVFCSTNQNVLYLLDGGCSVWDYSTCALDQCELVVELTISLNFIFHSHHAVFVDLLYVPTDSMFFRERKRGQFWNDINAKAVTSNKSDSFRRLWKGWEVESYKFHFHSHSHSLVLFLRIRVYRVRKDTNRSSEYKTHPTFLNLELDRPALSPTPNVYKAIQFGTNFGIVDASCGSSFCIIHNDYAFVSLTDMNCGRVGILHQLFVLGGVQAEVPSKVGVSNGWLQYCGLWFQEFFKESII